jgi:pectinesterase
MHRVLLLFTLFVISCPAFTQGKYIVVALDGSGDFKTIQEAVNAAPDSLAITTTIFIKKGIYKERLIVPVSKTLLRIKGEDAEKTIITYDNYALKKDSAGKELGTGRTASVYVYSNDFTAENITFENSSGPVGQALAIWVGGDRAIFKNCRFLGFQDTVYTHGFGTRQYFKDCYIEGTTDFIFGPATCVFKDCEIFCKKGGMYITAASTPDSIQYGYVFLHCKITGSAPDNSYYLGRPWRPYAKVVFIACDLGKHIRPEGWHNWGKAENEKTAYYAEYKNHGEGYEPGKRVVWAHQLTRKESKKYNLKKMFRGWNPL